MNSDRREGDLAAVGLLDEPVRRRLYDWVVARAEPVGRDAAAKSLGITRALAAFHLDRLAQAGLLETGYQRLTGRTGPGAGRPARVYWRAQREFAISLPERRYERVAQIFAAALERLGGASLAPVRDAAGDLGRQLGRTSGRRGPARRRLMATLERAGYEPAPDEKGDIRLRNCPFDALAQEHRSLVCGANLALAEGLVTGAEATQYRPVLDPQPGLCCVAFLQQPAEGGSSAASRPSG